ncbi:hypothetical protein [Sphaerisporangium sp. NPDC051011]|uniref:hypothetical protein n=1 Tax=Sphaerisporangium sp. NPDC051011 TaxID=3155792 RepID=UPI0033E81EAD
MTHRPDRPTPELTDIAGSIWRAVLVCGTGLAAWATWDAGATGELTQTVAAAAVLLALVGVLLASAIVARGRR